MSRIALELRAMAWLRFERRCPMVLFERSPRTLGWSRPDVLGVTSSRYLLEIECKRSMADLRANTKKPHVYNRQFTLRQWPKEFYLLVPRKMVDAALIEAPSYAGLMTVPEPSGKGWIEVVRKAPVNNESRKLSVLEAVRLAHLLSNQLWTAELRREEAVSRLHSGDFNNLMPEWEI